MSPLLTAAACFAERIKVNAISRETRDGQRVWIKRRRRSAPVILACANRFFNLAQNPVQALAELPAWQRWEIECFRLLHGNEYRVLADGPRTIVAQEVPGVSLSRHLESGTLTPEMTAATAHELRRAHALPSAAFGALWSHGDPHAGNFLYAAEEDRARLIDFEVMHHPALSAEERHADDLLVFLQDVAGRVSADAWLPLARAFVDAYDRPEIAARLAPRLILPRGIPRLWWAVRTTYLPATELVRRLEALRETLPGCEVTRQ
jgi:hypothetical protein